MGVLDGVGAEERLPGLRPITLIARPSDAADERDLASVGSDARRGRGEGGDEEAGRVRRV